MRLSSLTHCCCFRATLLAAWLVLDVPLEVFLFEQGGYWHIAFVVAVIMVGLNFNDLYENYRVVSRIRLLQQFCLVLGIAFLLQSALSYAQWGILLPKWTMVYGSLLVLIVLPIWRIFFSTLLWKSLGGQKLLFLGSSPAMREIVSYISDRPELGLASIGYLDDGAGVSADASAIRLGSVADLDGVCCREASRSHCRERGTAPAKPPRRTLARTAVRGNRDRGSIGDLRGCRIPACF